VCVYTVYCIVTHYSIILKLTHSLLLHSFSFLSVLLWIWTHLQMISAHCFPLHCSLDLQHQPFILLNMGLQYPCVHSLFSYIFKYISTCSLKLLNNYSNYLLQLLKAPHGDLLSCMEMLKVADLLVFVASARSSLCQQTHSHYIDSFGAQCLSVFRSLGLPTTLLFLRVSYHVSSFFNSHHSQPYNNFINKFSFQSFTSNYAFRIFPLILDREMNSRRFAHQVLPLSFLRIVSVIQLIQRMICAR
jgi:hypothetical protein